MLVLVYGGSGSGKSEIAEDYCLNLRKDSSHKMIYLATMEPFGKEARERIKRHRDLRKDKGFVTIEKTCDINEIEVKKDDIILLECMSNLVANEFFTKNLNNEEVVKKISHDIKNLSDRVENLIIVSNDIFSSGEESGEETYEYMKALGEINRNIAKQADEVYEAIVGLPVVRKKC